ncbi:MAG: acyl--CoA ligase, partial [Deltaproteobacteria bacterium]|nr:acyl--CoA ligase [Deltaproteobacteria bacterium]
MPAVSHPQVALVNLTDALATPRLVPAPVGVVQNLNMNLAQSFWNRLTRDDTCVLLERLEPNGQVTWRQTRGVFLEDASHWMAALHAARIGPGDRVALSLSKSAGLVTAHLAVLGVGASVVPLNPALTARETEAVLTRAEVRLAITHPETVTRSLEITATVRGPWWIVGQEENLPARTVPFAEVLAASRPGPEPVARSDDDLALLLFTSGTTGTPKGVGLTHHNLRANLQALLVETWEMNEEDRLLHALPPHHLHGLGLGLYGTLYVGNAMVLLER